MQGLGVYIIWPAKSTFLSGIGIGSSKGSKVLERQLDDRRISSDQARETLLEAAARVVFKEMTCARTAYPHGMRLG